jgi:hypothetical protein
LCFIDPSVYLLCLHIPHSAIVIIHSVAGIDIHSSLQQVRVVGGRNSRLSNIHSYLILDVGVDQLFAFVPLTINSPRVVLQSESAVSVV